MRKILIAMLIILMTGLIGCGKVERKSVSQWVYEETVYQYNIDYENRGMLAYKIEEITVLNDRIGDVTDAEFNFIKMYEVVIVDDSGISYYYNVCIVYKGFKFGENIVPRNDIVKDKIAVIDVEFQGTIKEGDAE